MKLTDLNPNWVSSGGGGLRDKDGNPVPHQRGVGITFNCPCGQCQTRVFVAFSNPLDGTAPRHLREAQWERKGDTFETLTLNPSLHRITGCKWHGWVRDGEVVLC